MTKATKQSADAFSSDKIEYRIEDDLILKSDLIAQHKYYGGCKYSLYY